MSFGILALVVAAGLGGPLLALGRRGIVPVVVGELAAGVVIGKTGTGWLDPGDPTTAFMANVGFAMLMFAAGMHVPIRQPGSSAGCVAAPSRPSSRGVLAVPARARDQQPRRRPHGGLRPADRERLGGDRAADPRRGTGCSATSAR